METTNVIYQYTNKLTGQIKLKMSQNHYDCKGVNNPRYGNPTNWKPSQSHIQSIIKANKGVPKSEEHKQKISQALKGKKRTLEHSINSSKWQNTSGYYRVSIIKCEKCNQGYSYAYDWNDEDGNHKRLKSINIEKLEQKVKDKGLIWIKYE